MQTNNLRDSCMFIFYSFHSPFIGMCRKMQQDLQGADGSQLGSACMETVFRSLGKLHIVLKSQGACKQWASKTSDGDFSCSRAEEPPFPKSHYGFSDSAPRVDKEQGYSLLFGLQLVSPNFSPTVVWSLRTGGYSKGCMTTTEWGCSSAHWQGSEEPGKHSCKTHILSLIAFSGQHF